MDKSQAKAEVRNNMLTRRNALDVEYRNDAAHFLVNYVYGLNISSGAIVSGYYPIRSEIDVRPLMVALEAQGAKLCLPVVIDRETIVFKHYRSDEALVDAGFGTMGPDVDAPIVEPDLMLMPLAAFDANGNRIGYGAGHYDRAIAKLYNAGKKPILVGCAFDCQCVDDIEAEAHDVPLHTVLTEKSIYHIKP